MAVFGDVEGGSFLNIPDALAVMVSDVTLKAVASIGRNVTGLFGGFVQLSYS
jgi:hypothetical protein